MRSIPPATAAMPIVVREISEDPAVTAGPALGGSVAGEQTPEERAAYIDEVIRLVRAHTGHDFSEYKRNGISGCLDIRMQHHRAKEIREYLHLLAANLSEVDVLFRSLLIGVTRFFRAPAAWRDLEGIAIPEILARYPAGGVLRVWVPGCSTGEEAYSLAISFFEAIERLPRPADYTVQVIATDIDTAALAQGKEAIYSATIVADVSPQRLQRFFAPVEQGYRVCREIREMVIFSQQNVVMDAPFTRVDLISCRNLMILLTIPAQQRLLGLFHRALLSGGTLFLGVSETIGGATALFSPVVEPSRIYRSLNAPVHGLVNAGADVLRAPEEPVHG